MIDEKSIIVNLSQLDFYPIEDELTENQINAKWKELCKVYHPDATQYSTFKGGEKQAKINAARDFLLKNLAVVNYYVRKTNHKLNEDDLRREREAAEQREREAAAKRAEEEAKRKAEEEARRKQEEQQRAAREEAERRRQAAATEAARAASARTQAHINNDYNSYSRSYSSSSSGTASSNYKSNYSSSSSSGGYKPSTKSRSPAAPSKTARIIIIVVIAIVLLIALIVTLVSTCSKSGGGSKIEISDREGLIAISENPDKKYALAADIDLSDAEWTPIEVFSGTFDGNGFKITGLTVKTIKTDYVGLFQYLNANAVVENVVLENLNINSSNTAKAVGGIAALSAGTVKNCSVKGTIGLTGCDNIGGIVGITYDSTKRIENCKFDGTIAGSNCVGGILGTENDCGLYVSGCEVSGQITGYSGIGGVVGYASRSNGIACTVENNVNNAIVTGGGDNVGGIVGNISSGSNWGSEPVTVSGNTNNGRITGKNNTGGIVGYISCSHRNFTLSSCTNTGAVYGGDNVGGIAGQCKNSPTLTGMSSSGNISGNSYVGGYVGLGASVTVNGAKNTGDITGMAFVGGIAGEVNACSDCENTGIVKATGSIDSYTVLGGIAGKLSTAKNCVNRGKLTASTVGNGVGGIAGLHQSGNAVEITNCENHGTINLINATSVGGIIGDITYSGMSDASPVLISGCTNSGDVTVSGTGNYVGGIIGRYQDVVSWAISSGKYQISSCASSGDITAENCSFVSGILGYSKGGVATLNALTVSGNIKGSANVAKISAMISSCPNIQSYSSSFDYEYCTATDANGEVYYIYILENA